MKIGYARVSTTGQSAQAQAQAQAEVDALERVGREKIITEAASGVNRERPKLAETLQIP